MRVFSKLKTVLIPVLIIALLLFSFFIIDFKWWEPQEPINFIILISFMLLVVIFEVLMIFFIKSYLKDSIIKMKNHFVIIALKKRSFKDLLIHFPLTMIFEEILFRLYVFTFLYTYFGFVPALLISALIFGIYHIHTWFEFKDKRITYSFIFISGILGIILNGLLYYFGILTCILVHWSTVLVLFSFINNRTP